MIPITKSAIILTILIPIIFLVVGFTLGNFYYMNIATTQQPPKLPIQPISNTVLQTVSGNVSGTLVDKKDILATASGILAPDGMYGKISLENNGNKAEVYISQERNLTQFFKAPPENAILNKDALAFSDLKIGNYIEGGITIPLRITFNGSPIIAAHVLTVYESKDKLP